MAPKNDFFVIIAENDRRLVRHQYRESALNEIRRLARTNPGQVFFLLHAGDVACVPEPEVAIKNTISNLPF